YTGLWLNERGFERAAATGRLAIKGTIQLCGSERFLRRNQNRGYAEQAASQHALVERYKTLGVPVERGSIMATFGCNFEGAVPVTRIVDVVGQMLDIAREHGVTLDYISLADTMAWATPASIKRVIGAVRDKYPDVELGLHLHDTRGMGIANA